LQRKSSSLIPGECWAFKGSVGYFVVQLSALVNVTTISYEHIAAVASPEERIASAPREFEVYVSARERRAKADARGGSHG
jgi:SUN domain-containing protein 1/2